jgi:hypothetical protein
MDVTTQTAQDILVSLNKGILALVCLFRHTRLGIVLHDISNNIYRCSMIKKRELQ